MKYILMKLVLSITILAIARKKSTVASKVGSLVHFNELREMEDGRINLNAEATQVRTRRDISSEETPSSVNKNICGIDGDQERLATVQNLVIEEINKRKAVENEYLRVLKEHMIFDKGVKETNASADIEVLRRVIKKTEDDGDILLKSEEQRANEEILKLQTQLDLSQKSTVSDAAISNLELTISLNTENIRKQLTQITNAENGFNAATIYNEGEKRKYDNCKETSTLLENIVRDNNNNAESIKNQINANDNMKNNFRQCEGQ